MKSRCVGHCCRNFTVEIISPNDDNIIRAGKSWAMYWLAQNKIGKKDLDADSKRSLRMLIPLEEKVEGERVYSTFTCKYFNPETGDCIAYNQRPKVCRNFPGQERCPYKECTYEK